jgi:TonB family protein
MPLATVYLNRSNGSYLKHQKYVRFIKILSLSMVLMLHVGLAVILLGSDTIKPINEPVFMEVLMLSVPAATTATQTIVKAASPIKKVPIFPPSISKKPSPLSIKKPVMIIPTDATGSSPSVTEAVSVEKAEPLSDPVSKDTAVTSQSAETIVKSIGPNSHEHDADKSVVISGIMPLIKVNPIYPNRAVSHGIEGWVRIEFTIQADGSVTDAVVVKAMPEDVFDDAALTAINQWQFKPKMVNGVAVPQRAGQQLQFKLDH